MSNAIENFAVAQSAAAASVKPVSVSDVNINDVSTKSTRLLRRLAITGVLLLILIALIPLTVFINPMNIIGNLIFVFQFYDILTALLALSLSSISMFKIASSGEFSRFVQISSLIGSVFATGVAIVRIVIIVNAYKSPPGSPLRETLLAHFAGAVTAVLSLIVNVFVAVTCGELLQITRELQEREIKKD